MRPSYNVCKSEQENIIGNVFLIGIVPDIVFLRHKFGSMNVHRWTFDRNVILLKEIRL